MANPEFVRSTVEQEILSGLPFKDLAGNMKRVDPEDKTSIMVRVPFETADTQPTATDQSVDEVFRPTIVTGANGSHKYKITRNISVELEGEGPVPPEHLALLQGVAPQPAERPRPQILSVADYFQPGAVVTHTSYGIPQETAALPAAPAPSENAPATASTARPKTKEVHKNQNVLHLKKGHVHWRTVGVIALASLAVSIPLALETAQDGKPAGNACESTTTGFIKQLTGMDPAQACEAGIFVGDMTNPLNLITGIRR